MSFENLYKSNEYRLIGGHSRCSICNCVSSEDIETDIGDFKGQMSFTPDPKDREHQICITCAEVINELKQEYEYDDLDF